LGGGGTGTYNTSSGSYATAGTANTGGGGGGCTGTSNATNGGSGVVIISYNNTYKAALVTGGGTQTNVGGNYIYTFTSSGTITF
jgi:hypothetical protein